MKAVKPIKIFIALLTLLILIFGFQLLPVEAQEKSLGHAWQAADRNGSYDYSTTILQTSRPLPKLANVGLSSRTKHIYIEGHADRRQNTMQMKLWSNGGSTVLGTGALEIKIENGKTYGRAGQEPWREVGDVTNLFAPGQDAFGFLRAATNVVIGDEQNVLSDQGAVSGDSGFTIYQFDLDGAAFAEYMRDTAVNEMRRRGELPPEVQVEASEHFIKMEGSGQIWVDDVSGLPVRQIINVTFPPDEYEQVEAVITTDFANWGRPNNNPTVLAGLLGSQRLFNSIDPGQFGGTALLLTLVLGLAYFLLRHGRNPKLYRVLAVSLILIMVIGPLWQSDRLLAYSEKQNARQKEYEQQRESRQKNAQWQAEQNTPFFEPQTSPLGEGNNVPVARNSANSDPNSPTPLEILLDQLPEYDDGSDADNDGLTDVDEILTQTDPNSGDSDEDGLADGVEVYKLGTDPAVKDSDGDDIPDGVEVTGFAYNNQQWYLNPNDPDSNHDGALDSVECSYDQTNGLVCPDTDGDGKPDIFDDDDDGDGVPDRLDSARNVVVGDLQNGLDNNRFRFEINELAANKAVYVDFQLRPINPEHLWYTLNVLDWPANDSEGQIQRVLDTTFYDQLTQDQISSSGADPQLKDGDLRLVPMLEIEIPYQSGHYGNLPVKNGAPPIQPDTPLEDWLDEDQLQAFGIKVRKQTETGGTLLATVPLTLIEDGDDNGPIAFSGRMFYRPYPISQGSDISDFGPQEEARLIWMVEVLTDTCSPVPDSFNPEGVAAKDRRLVWCEDPNNWIENGSTIVHVYEDEWVLTGMSVREDRGVDAAVIFEDPTFTAAQTGYTPDGFHDDQLWTLSQGLDRSFLSGRGGANRDLTIAEIASRWDKRQNGSSTADDRWGIPSDALFVETYHFDQQADMMNIPMTYTKDILANYFTAQAEAGGIQDPTFMFLREEYLRTLAIDNDDYTQPINNNGMSLTLDDATIPEIVIAGMNWGPYLYQGADTWASYPIEDYINDKQVDFETALTSFWSDPDDIDGARILAQSYYLTVHAGIDKVVEMADLPANLPSELTDQEVRDYVSGPNQTVQIGFAIDTLTANFDSMMYLVQAQFGSFVIAATNPLLMIQANASPAALTKGWFNQDLPQAEQVARPESGPLRTLQNKLFRDRTAWRPSKIKETFKIQEQGAIKPKGVDSPGGTVSVQGKLARAFRQGGAISQAAAIIGTLAAVGQIVATATGDINQIEVALVFASIQTAVAFVQVLSAAATYALVIAEAGSTLSDAIKLLGRSIGVKPFGFLFTLIISASITIGLFIFQVAQQNLAFGSLPFNLAFAGLVASLIVAVIFIAISSVPVIGPMVAAIIGIIDSVINIICLATGANQGSAGEIVQDYVCPGITGLLTKVVQFLIYDQTPVVNMDHENRLNLTNFDLSLADPNKGFVVGNAINFNLDVQTALYQSPFEVTDLLFAPYRYQFDDPYMKASTFDYQILSSKRPITEGLGLDQMTSLWQPPTVDSWASDSNFVKTKNVVADPKILNQAGINLPLPAAFLAEGYAVNVQECFTIPPIYPLLVPIPVCYLREDIGNNHIDLGQGLVFDVLPATIDDFMNLVGRENNGYTLAWWTNFPAPTLADADGDGLRSPALGGNDPNDSLPDTDNDTLSDYYEILIGTDPRVADGDGDNLNDAEELVYGTDPFRADTDSDGLLDGQEIAGWAFVYDFLDTGVPLETWVWSDPLQADPDGDGYLDGQEKQYAFNPRVFNSDTILALESTILDDDNIYRPGENVNYEVTLANELDRPYLYGLLDVDLPVAVQGSITPENFVLAPQTSVTLTDQVAIDNTITNSQVVSMTNRAGAQAIDLNGEIAGRHLWLHLEENAGAQTFVDSSLNDHDGTCSSTHCPTAGALGYQGRSLDFDGNDYLDINGTAEDFGFVRDSYTVQAWINADNLTGVNLESTLIGHWDGTIGFRLGFNDGHPKFSMDPSLTSTAQLLPGRWYRVTWRYDRAANSYAIFVDGEQVLNQGGVNFDYSQLEGETLAVGTFGLESYFNGRIDEVEIYPFAMSDKAIRDSYGNGSALVFYNTFEVNPVGTFIDNSQYQNEIAVATNDAGEDLTPQAGITGFVDQAYHFGNGSLSADSLEVASSPNLDLSRGAGAFTLSAWVHKLPEDGGWVMGNYDGAGIESGYPALRVEGDQVTAQFGIGIGITSPDCYLTTDTGGVLGGPNSDLQWHHVVATFDGVDLAIFVNNEFIDSIDCAGKKPESVSTFFIGNRDNSSGGQGYQGDLDDLRIYNYALNADGINDLFWDTLPLMELRLDDAPGKNFFDDYALVPHDGTCSGSTCPVSGLEGRINQAILLDGVDDAVALDGTDDLGLSQSSFTVSAWVNLDALDGEPVLGTVGSNSNELLILGVDSNLPYMLFAGQTMWGNTAVQTGRWTHLVWRNKFTPEKPGSPSIPAQSQLSIFMDGVQIFSSSQSLELIGNAPAYIGRYNGLYLNGLVDNLEVFRQALSDEQIAELRAQAPLINLHFNDDEGSTTFTNAATSLPNGTCSGDACPIAGVKGQIYDGINFDGQNDLVTVPYNVVFQSDSFSTGLWVKPQRKATDQSIVITESGGGVQYDLELPANSLQVYVQTRGSSCSYDPAREMTSVSSLIENSWNHVMLTYKDGLQQLYINGTLDSAKNVSGGICASTGDVLIGYRTGKAFVGGLDEFVYYPSSLTAAEVADLVGYQFNWFDTSYAHDIVLDADSPTVSIPVTAPFLLDEDLVLEIDAQDIGSGVASVEYRINGSGWEAASKDKEAWLFTFNPSGNGTYNIQARATDWAGNMTTTSKAVEVDGTGPVISPISNSVVRYVHRNDANDTWDVSLVGAILPAANQLISTSPPDRVSVSVIGEDGVPVGGSLDTVLTPSGFPYLWSVDYPFQIRPNGTYTVEVEAFDVAGNISTASMPIPIDGTPPVAAITNAGPHPDIINSPITLAGTAEDLGISSAVESIEVSFQPTGINDLSSVRVLDENNILHLPLDDNPAPAAAVMTAAVNDSMTFVDLSGFGAAATCNGTGCPATAERGKLGNAVLFDGVDDVITVDGAANQITGSAYSFGAWVYPQAGSGDDALLAFKGDQTLPSSLLFYRQSTNQFVYWDSITGEHHSGAYPVNDWYHVWVTVGGDNTGTLYVNGNAEATFSTTARPSSGDFLKLGRAWDGSGYRYFSGLLDDVAVYNVALDTAEIKRHYRGFAPVLRLPFDDDQIVNGGLVQDLSAYKNQAIMTQLAPSDSEKVSYPLPGAVGPWAYDLGTAYIDVVPKPYFDLSDGEFTQMAWLYPLNQPSNQGSPIFGGIADTNGVNAQLFPTLIVWDSTRLRVSFGDGTGSEIYDTSDILNLNSWNFVAVTFDGTDYKFYVDGVLKESTNLFAGMTPYPGTEFDVGHIQIAGQPFNSFHIFGYLDEVSLYRQTLNEQQIMALYQQGWQQTTFSTSLNKVSQPTNWEYAVPEGLFGSYQIQLRSKDTQNSSFGSLGNDTWVGHIDTTPKDTTAISLNAGWNLISSHIAPQNAQLETLLADYTNDLILLKNEDGQVFWPEFGINQIGSWDVKQGYGLYATNAFSLAIEGQQVVPENIDVDLEAGWSIVSYLRDNPMPVETALTSLTGKIIIVKNGNGQVYWPEYEVDTIGSLQTGEGYQIYLSAPGTLTYPANEP